MLDHGLQDLDEPVLELCRAFGDPAVEPVRLHPQPQPLDGVEIGRAWRQILRLEVMPVEALDLVPRGVVEHEDGTAAFHWWIFLRQGVEEHLEGWLSHRLKSIAQSRPSAGRTAPKTL